MSDQPLSDEKIYVDMDCIYRGMGSIRDIQGAKLFQMTNHWPPGGGSPCMVAVRLFNSSEVYESLLTLQECVHDLVIEYAELYGINTGSRHLPKKK
jgi:hypothetical protein